MPNIFKYHIRKLLTKKPKKTRIYQHTYLHYIFSSSPSAPEALGKTRWPKVTHCCPAFPDSMTMSPRGPKFPQWAFFPIYTIWNSSNHGLARSKYPLSYEAGKSEGKKSSFPSLCSLFYLFILFRKLYTLKWDFTFRENFCHT